MAFIKKIWKDRVAEYINRRTLVKEDGTTELVTVERSEGTISQEGDAFSAANMNDLEQRILDEFNEQNSKIDNIKKNTVEFLQGEATISQVYPGSTNSLLVQFEHPFSDIPVVLCSLLYIGEQSGPHVGNIESVSDITKSGFIVNIKNTGMTYARNYTFNWTANVDTSNT